MTKGQPIERRRQHDHNIQNERTFFPLEMKNIFNWREKKERETFDVNLNTSRFFSLSFVVTQMIDLSITCSSLLSVASSIHRVNRQRMPLLSLVSFSKVERIIIIVEKRSNRLSRVEERERKRRRSESQAELGATLPYQRRLFSQENEIESGRSSARSPSSSWLESLSTYLTSTSSSTSTSRTTYPFYYPQYLYLLYPLTLLSQRQKVLRQEKIIWH